jgi:Raf kinase inhibitor-like YbhB/YbcL family protein
MARLRRSPLLVVVFAALLVGLACGGDDDAAGTNGGPTAAGGVPTGAQDVPTETTADPGDGTLLVTSTGFEDGQPIPALFTCEGENVSPPLDWGAVPPGTVSVSVVLQDPDAPGGTFIHWIVANIPAATLDLPEGWVPEPSSGVVFGRNDFGQETYGGPCPPRGGTHRYEFRVFALDAVVDFAAGGGVPDLLDAMDGHILAEGLLTGNFGR